MKKSLIRYYDSLAFPCPQIRHHIAKAKFYRMDWPRLPDAFVESLLSLAGASRGDTICKIRLVCKQWNIEASSEIRKATFFGGSGGAPIARLLPKLPRLAALTVVDDESPTLLAEIKLTRDWGFARSLLAARFEGCNFCRAWEPRWGLEGEHALSGVSELSFVGCSLAEGTLWNMRSATGLASLHLDFTDSPQDPSECTLAVLAREIPALPALTSLALTCFAPGLSSLGPMPRLESLDVRHCSGVLDRIDAFAALKSLAVVDCAECDDRALAAVGRLLNLESVELTDLEITVAGLGRLRGLRSLRRLLVASCAYVRDFVMERNAPGGHLFLSEMEKDIGEPLIDFLFVPGVYSGFGDEP